MFTEKRGEHFLDKKQAKVIWFAIAIDAILYLVALNSYIFKCGVIFLFLNKTDLGPTLY